MKQKIFPIYLQSKDTFEQVKRINEYTHSVIVIRTQLNGYAKSLEMKINTNDFDRRNFENKDKYLPSSEFTFKKFAGQYGEHVTKWTKEILR